jgi:shikimate kinase
VAELVALCTNRAVFRTDDAVVERAGCSIPEFVEQHGWDAFWDLESAVVAEASRLRDVVIDTGGGVVRRPRNMALLKESGQVFWLTAHADTIKDRIKEDGGRPSLTGERSLLEEVADVLEARLPLYQEHADHVIETDGRTLGEIADEIVRILCGP